MSTVSEYIEARSNFDPTTPENIILISMAELEIGRNYCNDDLRNKAVSLVVMHWLSLNTDSSGNNSTVGTIKSEKEGDLSRSYGFQGKINKIKDPFWYQTGYGLELMSLNRSCFFGPRNRTMA